MHQRRHYAPRPKTAPASKVFIYGKHAVMEALTNAPQIVRKAFISPEVKEKELRDLLAQHKIPTDRLEGNRGRDYVGTESHQGIIATINPSALLTPFDDFLNSLDMSNPPAGGPAIAVLGEVQDPHNVGAIIRSAAAFGFAGVLIPEHNQAPITGTVVKTSAGMAFRVPLVSIGNVNTALAALKKKGFWIYGLSMEGGVVASEDAFDRPSAFVVGNEGSGIREKTLAACDIQLRIPMHPRTESLNAAVSAAVIFYEWSKKHPEALA